MDRFQQLAERYQRVTVAAGGALVVPVSAVPTEHGAEGTWSVSAEGSFDRYVNELEKALGGQFRRQRAEETAVVFRRSLAAEVHRIEVRRQSGADEDNEIRITLTVEPW